MASNSSHGLLAFPRSAKAEAAFGLRRGALPWRPVDGGGRISANFIETGSVLIEPSWTTRWLRLRSTAAPR